MESHSSILSARRLSFLRTQGYVKQSDRELADLAYGNRFAFRLCAVLLILGVTTASIPLLTVMMFIAFGGVILPYHPFDYIYNHGLRRRLNKPKLPPRSHQLKFACGMATLSIAGTIFLFWVGYILGAYIVGASLIGSATLVSTTDYCIPSQIYAYLFLRKSAQPPTYF